MSRFTEEELKELEAAFGLQRQESLPVRDGRVTRDSMVWWRGEKNCERVMAGKDWESIKYFPHVYQIEEPRRRVQYQD